MAEIWSGDELKAALTNISDKSDEEIRGLLDKLYAEENEISYRRRILHGQIDIIKSELIGRLKTRSSAGRSLISEGDIDQLSAILARTLTGTKDQ